MAFTPDNRTRGDDFKEGSNGVRASKLEPGKIMEADSIPDRKVQNSWVRQQASCGLLGSRTNHIAAWQDRLDGQEGKCRNHAKRELAHGRMQEVRFRMKDFHGVLSYVLCRGRALAMVAVGRLDDGWERNRAKPSEL